MEGLPLRQGRNVCLLFSGLVIFLLAMSMASISPAASNNFSTSGPTDPEEIEAFMDGAVDAQLKAHHIPGSTVSIVRDGRIIFIKGYGYADMDKQEPVVANKTLFRIGSITKLFVWTAVMQLSEQGRLDLDADVNIYLKDFQIPDTYPQPITLKNLMTHTAGFEDLATDGRIYVRSSSDIMPLGGYLKEKMPSRVRPPGELTAYSNYGAALAAYIVEQVSGMEFDQYAQKDILTPLGMNNTTFHQPPQPALALNLSKGYVYSNNEYTAEPFEYMQVWPGGSVSSTSEDMAKFMIAHLQNGQYRDSRILQEATAEMMHSQLFTNDPKVSGMTYGFWEMRLNNKSLILHGGDTILFHTLFVLLPESNLGLFISCNEQSSEPAIYELLYEFMDHYYPAPPMPAPRSVSGLGENASKFAGSYRMTRSAYTNFEKAGVLFTEVQITPGQNNTLIIDQPERGSEEWVNVAPLVFKPADRQSSSYSSSDGIVFSRDGQGNINHFFYVNNPTTAYEKVAWYEDVRFNYALLGACIILFLSTLTWPIISILNRPAKKPARLARAARWLAGAASMLDLLFLMGMASVLSISLASEVIYSIPTLLIALLILGLIAAFLTLGSIALGVLSWRNGYCSLLGRIHYTLVMLALVVFIWWLNNWNLLGFKF